MRRGLFEGVDVVTGQLGLNRRAHDVSRQNTKPARLGLRTIGGLRIEAHMKDDVCIFLNHGDIAYTLNAILKAKNVKKGNLFILGICNILVFN